MRGIVVIGPLVSILSACERSEPDPDFENLYRSFKVKLLISCKEQSSDLNHGLLTYIDIST